VPIRDNADNTTHFNLDQIICNSVSGPGSTAVGQTSFATGTDAITLGENTRAEGDRATSVGTFAARNAGVVVGATSIGAYSNRTGAGYYSTAIGAGLSRTSDTASRSLGSYSIAIGGGDGANFEPIGPDIVIQLNGAQATGFISTAIGTGAQAIGGGSIALGLGSKAAAHDSAAFGEFSWALGQGSVAMGLFSEARTASSIALGAEAIASGGSALAIGWKALASGNRAIAMGHGAKATALRAVAIGQGSVANVAHTFSVGAPNLFRRITNVQAGLSPNDAVNVQQLQAATAAPAVANMQEEMKALRALVQRLEARISQLEGRAANSARAWN
jgi:autotransporter adhesin